MADVTYPYRYTANPGELPAAGQVRANQGFGTLVTLLRYSVLDDDSADVGAVLLTVPIGADLTITVEAAPTNSAVYRTTGTPVDQSTYVEFPVSFQSSNGSFT